MFISYFEPVYFREKYDISIPFFYKQINSFQKNDIHFISGGRYFEPIENLKKENFRNLSSFSQQYNEFKFPTNKEIEDANKSIVPNEIFEELFIKIKENKLQGEKILLTSVYEPLKNYFDKVIGNLIKNNNIEGILTVKNCPSLEVVAKKYNLKVIHYETAALRPFNYQYLMYYDYNGVNGNTSTKKEFENFKEEYEKKPVKLLSNIEILDLLCRNNFQYSIFNNKTPEYEVGVALQIFDDSNLIAFSNGFDSNKILDFLLNKFKTNDILLRNHPQSVENKLLSFENVDKSPSAAEFIAKSNKLITINSSVAFETALYNKPVYILGQSPFQILSEDITTLTKKEHAIDDSFLRKLKINYLTFVYMIPYELFFNVDYLRYRLKNPSLIDIFGFHLNYYKDKKNQFEIDKLKNQNAELELKIINLEKQIKNKKINKLLSLLHKLKLTIKILLTYIMRKF